MSNPASKAYKTAFMGLMLGLALALSFLESLLPVLPYLPVGVKLGLSNIVTMYCLFFMGTKESFSIAFLKSAFVMLMRGPVGGALSLAGGVASVTVMLLLKKIPMLTEQILSIAGAISHNIGQLIVATFLVSNYYVLYYIPVLMIAGFVTGGCIGILAQEVFLRLGGRKFV